MADKYARVIELFRSVHDQLESWDDARFQKEEVSYKLAAVKKFAELLGKETFSDLLTRKSFDEILDRARKVGASSGLLYNSAPCPGTTRLGRLRRRRISSPRSSRR